MDERDYDIAMVEVIAANDALEQEWRLGLLGHRAKREDGSANPGSENTAIDNEATTGA